MNQKKLKRLMDLYKTGEVADVRDTFQIWAIPSGKSWGDSYKVEGERGADWCEMVEVARHFNNEGDGQLYYVAVGHDELGHPAKPSWREIKWICEFVNKFQMKYPPEERLTLEEVMAFTLMIGGNEWEEDLYS